MAHPDLDQLLNAMLPFAQQMLAKRGEFYPFGSSMTADGKVSLDSPYDGVEHPSSQQLIDLLTRVFHQSAVAGEIRAAGICYDIRAIPPGQTEKTDAICVSLEHQNGEAVDVCLPYNKGWFRRITYGQIFGAVRRKSFFA